MTEQLPQTVSQHPHPQRLKPNLSRPARSVSLAGGVLLAANGVRQGGLVGLAQLVVGAAAAWRGYSGVCQIKQALARKPRGVAARDASRVITRSIFIDKPRDEVFAFCREPQNIGALIPWVDALEEVAENTYEWRAYGPLDRPLHCTLVRSVADESRRLRWSTAWNGPWDHDILADFNASADGRSTQIKVIVACRSCAGNALAALLGKFADKALLNLLRSIKEQLETGQASSQAMGGTPERDFLFVHTARGDGDETADTTPDPLVQDSPTADGLDGLVVDTPRH